MGFNRREEMGILIREPHIVYELKQWFDRLWDSTYPIDISEVETKLASFARSSKPPPERVWFSFEARTAAQTERGLSPKSANLQNFAKAVRKFSRKGLTKDFLYRYFMLAGWLMDELDVEADDPRVVFGAKVVYGKTGDWISSLTINQRYFLLPLIGKNDNQGKFLYSFTIPRKLAKELGLKVAFEFRRLPGENGEPPIMTDILAEELEGLNELFFQGWIEEARKELLRARSAIHKRAHQSWLFRAATDENYRIALLKEAFGE